MSSRRATCQAHLRTLEICIGRILSFESTEAAWLEQYVASCAGQQSYTSCVFCVANACDLTITRQIFPFCLARVPEVCRDHWYYGLMKVCQEQAPVLVGPLCPPPPPTLPAPDGGGICSMYPQLCQAGVETLPAS